LTLKAIIFLLFIRCELQIGFWKEFYNLCKDSFGGDIRILQSLVGRNILYRTEHRKLRKKWKSYIGYNFVEWSSTKISLKQMIALNKTVIFVIGVPNKIGLNGCHSLLGIVSKLEDNSSEG
jgi:hypothetical protein